MKKLGGQDTRSGKQKDDRECKGFIRDPVTLSSKPLHPQQDCTPANSLKVTSAKKNISCPDSVYFSSGLPQISSMGNIICPYCIFLNNKCNKDHHNKASY